MVEYRTFFLIMYDLVNGIQWMVKDKNIKYVINSTYSKNVQKEPNAKTKGNVFQ